MRNDIDRFHLVMDTVKRLPQLGNSAAYLIQEMKDKLVEHRQYITTHGQDMPEVRGLEVERREGHLLILGKRRGQEQTELFLPS